ncbi:MAG: helix-turn-helix domain-containing protein [Chitinophagaceae bacterium]
MAKIKESATRYANKRQSVLECPVSYVISKIGGHWKPLIIYHLLSAERRYSELRKAIPTITEKMLIQHLKELEADGLVIRKAKPVVPPYVTYKLSPSGLALYPVMRAMGEWAILDSGLKPVDQYGVMEGLY